MAQNPLIKRYLDAGMAFTQMTQARAEAIVGDLVKAGEVRAAKTEELVNQILERSRKNTEQLLEVVRKEVRNQVASLGLATKDEVERVERQAAGTAANTSAAKKSPAKKSPAKKAKRSPKKSPAKKAPGKKAPGKKAPAKKAPAKKAPAKKAPGKKAPGKKAPAKKSSRSKKAAKKAASS